MQTHLHKSVPVCKGIQQRHDVVVVRRREKALKTWYGTLKEDRLLVETFRLFITHLQKILKAESQPSYETSVPANVLLANTEKVRSPSFALIPLQ